MAPIIGAMSYVWYPDSAALVRGDYPKTTAILHMQLNVDSRPTFVQYYYCWSIIVVFG